MEIETNLFGRLSTIRRPLQEARGNPDGPKAHVKNRKPPVPHSVRGYCFNPAPATAERCLRRVKPFLKTEYDKACANPPPGDGKLLVRERLLPICVVRFTTIKFHALNALINTCYWTLCGVFVGAVVGPERTKP